MHIDKSEQVPIVVILEPSNWLLMSAGLRVKHAVFTSSCSHWQVVLPLSRLCYRTAREFHKHRTKGQQSAGGC
jgi:hypothetical protein